MVDYYNRKELSNSDIQLLLKSPLHYIRKGERKTTDAMQFGSAFHCLVLEPKRFNELYVVCDISLATKEGKQFKEENQDKTLIKQAEYEKMQFMRDAVFGHPLSFILNGNIETEKEIYFNYNDVDCRCKIDMLNYSINTVVDLKSIADCRNAEKAVQYDYCTQGVFYTEAAEITYNDKYDFVFIFVEKESPYGVKFIQMSEDTIQRGREKIADAIEIYKSIDKRFIGYSEDFIYA